MFVMGSLYVALLCLCQSGTTFAKCLMHDYEIQKYLTSSEPPWDNYFKISKAVFPAVDLPSLMIRIWVVFVNDSSDIPTSNETIGGYNRSDSKHAITTESTYTWSMSCLYLGTNYIKIDNMNLFSLLTIWPNRRQTELRIKLPQLCPGVAEVETMTYWLSTLQDIAVKPTSPDPNLNTVDCVIKNHEKATFTGIKKTLHYVCWSVMLIALAMSTIASQVLTENLRVEHKKKKPDRSKTVAILFLLSFIFIVEIVIIVVAFSNFENHCYVFAFLISFVAVLLRRFGWCLLQKVKNEDDNGCISFNFLDGHDEETSTNAYSWFIVYPAMFAACHHLLWITLGIMTEPFWALPVLVALVAFFFVLYYVVYNYHENCFEGRRPPVHSVQAFVMSLISCLIFGSFNFVLLVVGQGLLNSHSMVSSVVQSALVTLVTVWYKHVKDSNVQAADNCQVDKKDESPAAVTNKGLDDGSDK